jgi:uncharacterized protein YjiK
VTAQPGLTRLLYSIAILAVTCVVGLAAWRLGYAELGYYLLRQDRDAGLRLASYRAVIDGKQIDGISDNASGLTYNPNTGTLFAAINRPPQVVELSIDGTVLRRVPVTGAWDLEGITHVGENTYLLADETRQRLYLVLIEADTKALWIESDAQLIVPIGWKGNRGIEGLSWDEHAKRLYAVKEKAPPRIVTIDGLTERSGDAKAKLHIADLTLPGALLLKDLSSLSILQSGHILLLSDESQLLVEYDADGSPIGVLPLRKGWHGLRATLPAAEGVAVGDRGQIFIVSEPNLFYRFEP